jgi:DNA (cytosine-5)-methyltransferase 1
MIFDLFSGAGGLSLGFEMAGFEVDLAIETNESFYKSYVYNHPECITLKEDITKLQCLDIQKKHVKNESVYGIIGGPPCIGFSTVGNRKLDDPRNMLIFFFIKWVEYFKPTFFVMENVPGILTMAKGKVVEKIVSMYKDIGYYCKIETLLAAEFGVPQLRQRVLFMGTQDQSISSLKIEKTNKVDSKQTSIFEEFNLPRYLTVEDAISDIIDIVPYKNNSSEISSINYSHPPNTKYQHYLRKDSNGLYEHIAPNHSKLVVERISHIKQGENHASLPKEFQLESGYPNIYGRLDLKHPADTITGNCGCVSAPGRFIHPTQNRAISVREAARFQSFPDNYRFFGNMKDKYKQVGNAVPPLLAYAVAKSIKKLFNKGLIF